MRSLLSAIQPVADDTLAFPGRAGIGFDTDLEFPIGLGKEKRPFSVRTILARMHEAEEQSNGRN